LLKPHENDLRYEFVGNLLSTYFLFGVNNEITHYSELFLESAIQNPIHFSKDTMAKIFEPFFTTKFTERGLDLSTVLGIVRGHHGMVKIYSEEGKGTTFKVLFPLYEDIDGSKSLTDNSL